MESHVKGPQDDVYNEFFLCCSLHHDTDSVEGIGTRVPFLDAVVYDIITTDVSTAAWIKGKKNIIADAISRLRFTKDICAQLAV